LIVTAAMLQPPVLDLTQEAAAQYGSFGALVGHELSHGFDNRGRLVDAKVELRDWWTPAETGAWEALSNRIAAQYNGFAYPVLTGIKVNGNQVRDIAIADLAGVELAWAAYNTALTGATKESKQAFYNGWARLWPEALSPEAATLRAATSVYAPGQWRANGPLLNQPTFAEVFACKPGTPMAPKPDQRIVMWPTPLPITPPAAK